ncbi:hypothetical protein F5B22DRAFT_633634 [Xylaria bambusicola]|uniref:uncharacterized protein n=1 Tax=Xylaria bambusicola TaxID=326684 RepID=UPI002008D1B7|nr:uncharacterized protein F5B22DRAFT_633634 [Xylaria bambusicola]KAI0525542.1 hypothetical protein F5B22DRAFT_633634 [Xylaria bambusicola]
MAYTVEPEDGDILTLQDMFNIPRAEAVSRLKANKNDLGAAINEKLDDPASTKYKWDESAFDTDREGGWNNGGHGWSFNIQSADEVPVVSHVNNAAPTRPPSRTNNRSPLGPSNATQEDADLARAIAESAAESGVVPQEAGVINNETSSKYFGPANRSEYESEKWAMIPTKATAETDATDPPPSNRRRDADAPAFLRQTKLHRLGAILSIYNQIPLARNFLLSCGVPTSVYGQGAEWWKGKPILRQIVLGKLARGEEVWGEDAHPDFVEELHRLLAFLDSSERSYASADSLAETKAIDPTFGSWMPDVEDKLFQALQETSIANPNCGIEEMTTTGMIMPVIPPSDNDPEWSGQDEEEDTTTSFIFLDLALDFESYSRVDTMYDALDHLLWSSALSLDYSFPHNAKTAVLLKPGEVLTIRFGGSGFSKPCEIPAIFYADRYMNDRKDLAIHFQTQIRQIRSALEKLAWKEEELVACTGELCCFNLQGFRDKHDIRQCCARLMKFAEQLLERHSKDVQWRQFEDQWKRGSPYSMDDLRLIHTWSGPSIYTDKELSEQEKWKHIIQACRDKIEEAERTVTGCQRKKQELNHYLDIVRKRLTCQEHEADNDLFVFRSQDAYRPEFWNPTIKYLLRGVATTTDVAYVCVREDSQLNLFSEATPSAKDQWWKVGYVASDASPIKCEKVTPDDVLQAAGTESKNPILVYASEVALNRERIPLSDALRTFIKHDNRLFQQELAQEASLREVKSQNQEMQMQNQSQAGVTAAALSQLPSEVGTGGKRKYSVGSSVATNGSIRSDLAEVEFAFDDSLPALNNTTEPTHQHIDSERTNSSNVVESHVEKCETHEQVVTKHTKKEEEGGSGVHHCDSAIIPDVENTFSHKAPEMSERKGGRISFLAQADHPAQNSVDLMDLDAEPEFRGG